MIQTAKIKYRYTIQQLLELSSAALLPFDLSRFSYDAARAGVVPPLSDCAMSSRKTSAATRLRDVSSESSAKDVLYVGGGNFDGPSRQPENPPPEQQQKEEGFAKFLKKHTSPNHNRVTAGGRIVPMERPTPPLFALNASHQPKGLQVPSSPRQNGNSVQQAMVTHPDMQYAVKTGPFPYSQKNNDPVALWASHTSLYTNAPSNMHFSQSPKAIYQAVDQANLFPGAFSQHQTIPYFSNNSTGVHGGQAPSSRVPIASQSGLVQNMGWTYGLSNTNSDSQWPVVNHRSNVQGQEILEIYTSLMQWQQHYAELDQQLKDIDRHRAMHTLDRSLAEQRKVIVQQRSDAKDTISSLKAVLGVSRYSDSSQDSFTQDFNVDAPAYVPHSTAGHVYDEVTAPAVQPPQAIGTDEKPMPQVGKRVIPIKAPPEANKNTSNDHEVACQPPSLVNKASATFDAQRSESNGSEGVKDSVGHARAGLHKESMGAVERQPMSSDTEVSMSTSSSGDMFQRVRSYKAEESFTSSKVSGSMPKDGYEEYQELLKAVSRPKGVITKVTLLDGRNIDVQGQGLNMGHRSPVVDNDDVPIRTIEGGNPHQQHVTQQASRSGSAHWTSDAAQTDLVDKANLSVRPQGRQKAATDAFLAQYNVDESIQDVRATTQSEYLSAAHRGTEENVIPLLQDQPLKALGHNALRHFPSKGTAIEPAMTNPYMQQAADPSIDAVGSKGLSLVSVQNIHALSRLPHNLDGSGDLRKSVLPTTLVAEKGRSPRRLQYGQHGNGLGWFGQF